MTKSNYSDDKNPYFVCARDKKMTEVFNKVEGGSTCDGCDFDGTCRTYDDFHTYKGGYLAAEEALAFTDGEKRVMRKMLLCFNWDMARHDFDMFDVESLKKKVLGER